MNRSLLFIPGNAPKMLNNCDVFGADGLILDLEDSVPFEEKDAARILVRNALGNLRDAECELTVRVNSKDTEYFNDDIREIVPMKPAALVVPKVSTTEDVQQYDNAISEIERLNGIAEGTIKFYALIETALSILHLEEIVAHDRIAGIILGTGDLGIDLHIKRTKEEHEFLYVRSKMVAAARAYGKRCYDTPHLLVHDLEDLEKQVKIAVNLGFSGKAAIHPKQIPYINEYFSPTEEEIKRAQAILDSLEEAKSNGKAAKMVDGIIVDNANIRAAKEILGIKE